VTNREKIISQKSKLMPMQTTLNCQLW
jgi:hypothetical protein